MQKRQAVQTYRAKAVRSVEVSRSSPQSRDGRRRISIAIGMLAAF